MTEPWVLALDPPTGGSDPTRKVGGLSIVLRLALDAQACGATAIVLCDALRPALADPRLHIPLTSPGEHEPDRVVVRRVAASVVSHRRHFSGEGESAQFGFAPIDVVDDESARRAERALFRSLRKPADGWTSRYLNRPISLAISRWLVRTPLTPNQVSVVILGVGLAGALAASRGTYAYLAVGAALFHAQSVLDGCDGEMSRVTHRGSLAGEWLDTVGDDLTNYAFFGAAGFGLYRSTGDTLYLVSSLVTVGAGVITSGIEYRYLLRIGSGDLLKYPLSQGGHGGAGGRLAFLHPLFKRDTFVFLTLLAALAGMLGPVLVVFAVAALGILVGVFRTELRLAREKRA